jgi:thiamine pyrophosphokinase
MQKLFSIRHFWLLPLLLIATIQQSYAYQLYGYKWADNKFDYYINPTGVDDNLDYSEYSSTIREGANFWESVETSDIEINYKGTTDITEWGGTWPPDYQNTITWVGDTTLSKNVIGISTAWYSGDDIIDSDIKLNAAFASDSRLPQLVAHEVGHSLGIGHTRESDEDPTDDEYNAIMYWQLHTQTELNQEDFCAITAIYPLSEDCSPSFAEGYFECTSCCSGEITMDISFANLTQTYSGTCKSITVTTSPENIAYTISYTNEQNQTIDSPVDAGTYTANITITEPGYESEGPFQSTLTINKKTLYVSANDKTIDYGDDQPDFDLTYKGFVNGEDKSVLTTAPSAFILNSWPLTPGTYTIYSNLGVDDNYNFTYSNGTLTINALSVEEVIFSNYQHFYDGDNKEISVSTQPANINYTLEYFIEEQETTETIDAGSYNVILTISETGYTATEYNATMEISKSPLTISTKDQAVLLNDPEPTYTLIYSGFKNGENETVLDSLPFAYINESWPLPVGDYTIEVTVGNDNNYSITAQNGTLTVYALAPDSITFDQTATIYNGLSQVPTITTFPDNLDYTVSYYNENNEVVLSPTNAGTYLTVVTITQEGYDQMDYETILIIEKAPLDILVMDDSIVYGDDLPEMTFSITGFVNNETITDINLSTIINESLSSTWDVGTYTLTPQTEQVTNYTLNISSGKLIIDKAKLIVTPDDQSIKYNDPLPEFTYTITGYVNNENEEAITTLPFVTNQFDLPLEIGNYTIDVNGGLADNYYFEYLSSSLLVEAIGDAEITCNPIDTCYTGLPIEASISTTPDSLNYTVEYSETPLNAGSYQAIIKLNEPGYICEDKTIEITINKTLLNTTVEDVSVLWGDDEPIYQINYDGFVNNETSAVIDQCPQVSTSETWPVKAGLYSLILSDGQDNNYEFSFVEGKLTVIQTYLIEVNTSEHGWISLDGSSETNESIQERVIANSNSSTFRAIAKDGYIFNIWSNGQSENPITLLNIEKDSLITAQFEIQVSTETIPSSINQLIAYPNPSFSNEPITLKTILSKNQYSSAKIKVNDVFGRPITTLEDIQAVNHIELQSKGIYIITLYIKDVKSAQLKLLIK